MWLSGVATAIRMDEMSGGSEITKSTSIREA